MPHGYNIKIPHIEDLPAIAKANELCNRYGMDTIRTKRSKKRPYSIQYIGSFINKLCDSDLTAVFGILDSNLS